MKKIISLILLACIALFAVSCGGDGVPDNMQLASHGDVAYLLYVPKSWNVNAQSDYSSAYYSSADTSNVSVFFFSPEEDMSLDEYWASFTEEYKATFPTMTEIESANVMLGGKTAAKHIFTATVSGKNYKFMQIVTTYGGLVYTLTYTAEVDNFDLHTEEVQTIVDNFKFR